MIIETKNVLEYLIYYAKIHFDLIFLIICLFLIFYFGFCLAQYLDEAKRERMERIRRMRK